MESIQRIQRIKESIQKVRKGQVAIVETGGRAYSRKTKLERIGEKGNGLLVKAQTVTADKDGEILDGELRHALDRGPFETHNSFDILYYPSDPDIEFFARSADTRMDAGPGTYFPGAVGSAKGSIFQKKRNEGSLIIEIDYLQGHFKIGEPIELDAKRARKYGGWKRRIIECIFEIAKECSAKGIVFGNRFNGKTRTEFEDYCRENKVTFFAGEVFYNSANVAKRTEHALLDATIERWDLFG